MKQIWTSGPSSRHERRGLMTVLAMVALVLAVAYSGQLLRTARQPVEQARSAHRREQLDWLLRAAGQRAALAPSTTDNESDTATAVEVWDVELQVAGADAGRVEWHRVERQREAGSDQLARKFTAQLLQDGRIVAQESRVINVVE